MQGQGNSVMVSVSVCQVGRLGSSPVWSACFRKVVYYQWVMNLSPPVPTTGSPKAVHVLLCLCNNACKRSLAICRKSRALCPVSRRLSVPIWVHVLNRDDNMIQTNKNLGRLSKKSRLKHFAQWWSWLTYFSVCSIIGWGGCWLHISGHHMSEGTAVHSLIRSL